MRTTKVFSDLLRLYIDPLVRVIVLKGSTRSSKTWSTLQLLNYIGQKSTRPRRISVVSESIPHLKRGCISDFKNMLESENKFEADRWHDTNKTYDYGKGQIEFFSVDKPSKVLGAARQVLYMNEAINISFDTYRQLAVRTTEKIILDYNPAFESWIDSKVLVREDARMIHSTYLDNDMLTPAQIAEIESNKEIDPDWWQVYGLGLTGSKEGLVVKNWDIVADLPPRSTWKQAHIGIDFGWTAPTAVILIVLGEGGETWHKELGYGANMGNKAIAECIKFHGYGDIEAVCDAAEPKSIQDLRGFGINAVKSDNKEISLGIEVMNRYKKHFTADSVNTIAENRMYRYGKNAEGVYTGIPIKAHGHAKDAERYVYLNRLSNVKTGVSVSVSKRRQ